MRENVSVSVKVSKGVGVGSVVGIRYKWENE